MISLPKVIALIKPKESTVDIIVDKIATKNKPKNIGGSISFPNSGNVYNGDDTSIATLAYKPVVIVKISKTNQNNIDIKTPFFAVSGDWAAEHRW
tara:strand:+ start:673 stop:957 length:285 start_codon:yes stop_codon:yes gene_type:complete